MAHPFAPALIVSDPRLWRRNCKFGQLPGDLRPQTKEAIFKGELDKLNGPNTVFPYKRKACRGFKKEVVKKANRRWRHEFKQLIAKEDIEDTGIS